MAGVRTQISSGGNHCPEILVTGGTGFYGQSLVSRLISRGHAIRLLCRSDKRANDSRIVALRGDVRNREDLRAAMRGCDTVFHCASEKYDAGVMRSVNVEGTRLVMDVADEFHVKFFCHLSSVGVVGKTSEAIVREDSVCNPMNQYEETKLAAEEIVARGLSDGRVVVLRPTNIFGSRSMGKLLSNTLLSRCELFLKGNEHAHMVYIEDVTAAAMYCWKNCVGKSVEKFIVSSDEEQGVTYKEVQAELANMLRSAPKPVRTAAPQILPYLIRVARNGSANQGNVVYSSVKLRKAGFSFPFGLKGGLRDAVSLLGGSIA